MTDTAEAPGLSGLKFRVPLYVIRRSGDDINSQWEAWRPTLEALIEDVASSIEQWLDELDIEDAESRGRPYTGDLLALAIRWRDRDRDYEFPLDAHVLDLFCGQSDTQGWREWGWRQEWLEYDITQVEQIG